MQSAATILIVDDEKNIREGLKLFLKREGYTIILSENGNDAIEQLKENDIDLVISDLRMPGMDGDELLTYITKNYPGIPVILITGHGSVENAVNAMKNGAYDFVTKPFSLEKLGILVQRALSQRQLIIDNKQLKTQLEKYNVKMIGKSDKITQIIELASQVAPSKASILILGENGVGKEVVANMIHAMSNRKDNPFIKVHCAALSESLLESELFGHEKGSFTGAVKDRKGRFELADKGTIFLDEIGEIPQSVQIKLLRVIQERTFERVGGEKTIKSDVRILAATNRDLKKEVEEGRFREDLYYRLNVVQMTIPPLRERREDIPLLISDFVANISKENGKIIKEVTPKAMMALQAYDWPGNVRELSNVIESSVVLSRGDVIDVVNLPAHMHKFSEEHDDLLKIKLPATLAEIEKEAIEGTLRIANWNKSKAAEILSVNRKTLYSKISEYQLAKKEDVKE